jgi:hypothetical protein
VTLDEVILSEPNVLLLDYANYRLELGSEWPSLTEILHIENTVRKQLSLPLKLDNSSQLWAVPSSARISVADLHLRFAINSTIYINATQLAIEDSSSVTVLLGSLETKRVVARQRYPLDNPLIPTIRRVHPRTHLPFQDYDRCRTQLSPRRHRRHNPQP